MNVSRTKSAAKAKGTTSSGLNLDLISLNTMDQVEQLIQGLMNQLKRVSEENEELRRYAASQRSGRDSQLEHKVSEIGQKDEVIRRLNTVLSQKESEFHDLQATVEKQRRELLELRKTERPAPVDPWTGGKKDNVKKRIEAALEKLDELENMITSE